MMTAAQAMHRAQFEAAFAGQREARRNARAVKLFLAAVAAVGLLGFVL